ncbi:MAG: hypothetical protein ACQEUG_10920 [Pseudomonadota bacterium]
MPTPSATAARLVFQCDELLALAKAHEGGELARYRRLAFGFLTFNTAISRLMASLGIECEKRLDTLRHAARQQEAEATPFDGSDRRPVVETRHAGSPFRFISHYGMAIDTLHQAAADADYSRRFYEHLQMASAVPAFHPTLTAIIKQKRAECDVLQEYLSSSDDLRYRASVG